MIMAIAILAVSFSTNAATITLNVDDPSRVEVQVQYEPVTLEAGVDTQFEIEDYTSIYIVAKDGNFLKSVTRRGSYAEQVYNMSSCSLYCNTASDYEGVVWDIVSCNADDARDAEVIVIADEGANISCQRSNTYSYVTLADGENKVKFMSQDEIPLTFSHNTYDKTLYQVTHNNVAVEPQGSYFYVSPQDGDTIKVTSNFPDVDVPVKFTYGEGAEGFITSVTVDGTSVTNYNDDNFTVKLGSKIVIRGNTSDYKFDSLVINGETYTNSYFYSYEFTATETEYNIEVNAHPYGTIKAYVTVDNPNNVTVYRGYSSSGDIVSLEAGVKTEVELSENNPMLSWAAASGCFIDAVSVTIDGVTSTTSSTSLRSIVEGTEISITTGVIVRDKTALVWIDDKTQAQSYCSFYGSYDRYLHSFSQLETGYNEVVFGDIDNPFQLSLYATDSSITPAVYQNDNAVEYKYGYNVTFADKDVVKLFFSTATPSFYNVTFETSGDVSAVSCTKDIISTVEAWQDGFSVLQGTQIDIAGSNIAVEVNGVAVTADENSKYTFTVGQDTNVKITGDSSGIEGISTGVESKDNNVYNLQGILIKKNATDDEISSLAKGMYIINGKKVFRK